MTVTGDWVVPFAFNSLMGKHMMIWGSDKQIKWTWSHSSKSEHTEVCSVGKKQIQVHLIYSLTELFKYKTRKRIKILNISPGVLQKMMT